MMRLMLRAELLGLPTCPLSQAVDFAAFRTRVQGLMGWVGLPADDAARRPPDRAEVGAPADPAPPGVYGVRDRLTSFTLVSRGAARCSATV